MALVEKTCSIQAERLVRGHQQLPAFVAVHRQLKQQPGLGLVLTHVADLVNDEQGIAIEKAESAGVDLISTAASGSWAMPQHTLPTDAGGNPKPSAQRIPPTPTAPSSKAVTAGCRATTARQRSMAITS